MFATYKYCLAQSTPSNLILTTKRELNSDGVRAFFMSMLDGMGPQRFVSHLSSFLTVLSLLNDHKTIKR